MSSILADFSTDPAIMEPNSSMGLDIIGKKGQTNFFVIEGEGDDIIIGGNKTDFVKSGLGNDILNGGSGDDILDGGDGNDILIGGTGSDVLKGGDGNDILIGGIGNDILKGGDGDDILIGDSGNDILKGGDGNDILIGGTGKDVLRGGDGKDVLIGGIGKDVFEFFADDFVSGEIDYISDFTSAEDAIRLKGIGNDANVLYDSKTGKVSVNGEDVLQLDPGVDLTIDDSDKNGNWELF